MQYQEQKRTVNDLPLNLETGQLPAVSGSSRDANLKISVSRKTLAISTTLLVGTSTGVGGAIGYGLNQLQLTKAENKAAIATGQIAQLDDRVQDLCEAAKKMRKQRQ